MSGVLNTSQSRSKSPRRRVSPYPFWCASAQPAIQREQASSRSGATTAAGSELTPRVVYRAYGPAPLAAATREVAASAFAEPSVSGEPVGLALDRHSVATSSTSLNCGALWGGAHRCQGSPNLPQPLAVAAALTR